MMRGKRHKIAKKMQNKPLNTKLPTAKNCQEIAIFLKIDKKSQRNYLEGQMPSCVVHRYKIIFDDVRYFLSKYLYSH